MQGVKINGLYSLIGRSISIGETQKLEFKIMACILGSITIGETQKLEFKIMAYETGGT